MITSSPPHLFSRSRALGLAVAVFLLLPSFVLANDEDDPTVTISARIAELTASIESEQALLTEVTAQLKAREAELKKLRAEVDKLKGSERLLSGKLKSVTDEQAQVRRELEQLGVRRQKTQKLAVQRLRALYMNPKEQLIGHFLKIRESESFAQHGYYLSLLHRFDLELLRSLTELEKTQSRKQAELSELSAERAQVLGRVKEQRTALASKLALEEPLLKTLKQQRQAREGSVLSLRAQVLRFETVLAGLTGAEDEAAGREVVAEKRREAREQVAVGFDGPGLEGRRGKLRMPVRGELSVGFGKDDSDGNRSRGLWFQTQPDAIVAAVAPGRAVFVGKMPGFGEIVVVDHGERSFSLYGRLGSVEVERGEKIGEGATIGVTSTPTGNGSGNFYFEIRRAGVALDPTPYLAGRSSSAAQ